MTSILVTSRRARLLADALDGSRPLAVRATVRATGDPALRERGVDLVELAAQLPSLAAEPQPGFALALREQLMVAAVQRELALAASSSPASELEPVPALPRQRPRTVPQGAARPGLRPARGGPAVASALATVLVVGGGAVGLTAVSSSSQPGDLLYPVKRGVERVDLALQSSAEAEGLVLLDQSATRLGELATLLATGVDDRRDQQLVVETLDDFAASTVAATDALDRAAQERPLGPSTSAELRGFLDDVAQQLAQVARVLPPAAADAYGRAAGAVNDLDRRARVLCGTCATVGSGALVEVDAVASSLGPLELPAPSSEPRDPDGASSRGSGSGPAPDGRGESERPAPKESDQPPKEAGQAPPGAVSPPESTTGPTVPPPPDAPDTNLEPPGQEPPPGNDGERRRSQRGVGDLNLPEVLEEDPTAGDPGEQESGPLPLVPVETVPVPEVNGTDPLLP